MLASSSSFAQDRFVLSERSNKRVYKYNESMFSTANWATNQSVSPSNGSPDDIVVTNEYIYVLDNSSKRVYRYGYSGGTPTTSRQLRLTGTSTSEISSPFGLAIDEANNEMWVASDALVLYRYPLDTAFTAGAGVNAAVAYNLTGTISGQSNGKVGGLALDATYVYILDWEDGRLYRRQRSNGSLVSVSRRMRTSASANYNQLHGVSITGDNVYVVNNDSANTVIRYSLTDLFTDTGNQNATAGNFWATAGANGDPYGIGINPYPQVDDIVRADASPTNAASVDFTVTFSESVSGVDETDFSLTTTGGVSGVSITSVTGSGDTYTVSVGTGSGSGTVRLDFIDDDSVSDIGNLPIGGIGTNGDFVTGEVYVIDNTAPEATVITPSTTGPTNATSVSFDVTFSEDVVNFDDAEVVVNHTGTASTSVDVTGSGASYTVTVNGLSGDGSFTVAVSTSSDVEDAVGNGLASSATSGAVTIDNTQPVVAGIVPETAQALLITFDDASGMAASVLLPENFTASGPGLGTLSPTPDSVEHVSGNTYRLIWNTGGSINGQQMDVTVDATLADLAGNQMDANGLSASMIAVPVTVSGFFID